MLKLIAAAALAATAATAAAQTPGETADTYSVAVRSADLNLASASGLATFRGRVRAAAAHACGDTKVAPLIEATQIAQCRAGFERTADGRVSFALARQDNVVAGTR
ncbi:MAG: UrcA family protein [Alphaproteobacteria bacterium]|nr:UrcA family protein [Alphaproteobacteria bacterium]